MSRSMLDEDDDYGAMQDEVMSDDDNAAPDMQSEAGEAGENEDPLLLAIDDLEGRVVSALDDVKLHPGVRSSSAPGSPSVHEELSTLLRPVLEVAAHTGPSVARTYYHGIGNEGVEVSCEDVYQRVVSDLVLPVILEMAQSDTIPAKRAASLEFFKQFFQECQKAGSWLDATTIGPQMGPYGSGSSSSSHSVHSSNNPMARSQQKRRSAKKLAREGEILRYWVQASIACTVQGVFTSEASETAVASRGIIAASSSLRPSLKHIAQRIKTADDRGASKLFTPVMKMVEGVLKKLFLSTPEETAGSGDSIRASSIKFLEILTLVCSRKPQDPQRRRGGGQVSNDFSIEDLPSGHPIITQESLEEISEYSFAALRGLVLLGGQVKIDGNLLSDMLLTGGGNGSPAAQVVSILKPAALAYLEIESQLPTSNDSAAIDINLNRSDIEFDFMLSMKSYSLSLNALSALGLNRPMFFKDSALCLARRATQPPVFVENGALTKAAVLAITAHLKASCLTLLRNALSVSTNSSEYLHEALKRCDMEIQATKALSMAKQANSLKTAGRAARNRANMFYEWDASAEKLPSKRQRDTDDALAKMRAAKKARGLGQGIQLPKNMADAVELVVANLSHLPPKRPPGAAPKSRRVPVTLDFVIDAIMTNGASLAQEEGRWYDRDGGDTWSIHWENQQKYELSDKFLKIISGSDNADVKAKKTTKDPQALFQEQAECAASDAVGRIAIQSMNFRSKHHSDFGNELAARLAWTLKKVKAPAPLAASSAMAAESLPGLSSRLATPEKRESLSTFLKNYPIVNSCLALDSTIKPENSSGMTSQDPAFIREKGRSLSDHILFEAYVQTLMTQMDSEDSKTGKVETYENSIGMCLASVVRAAQLTDEKPSDAERKQVAVQALSVMQGIFGSAPQIFMSSLEMAGALCDVADITKRSVDAARKSSQQTIAASAALHAAKVAAEKRATTFLLMLRDVAFGRSERETRGGAVECAVMVASGSLPSSHSIEEKSLKLVMNVLYPRSDLLAACVIRAASSELLKASTFAASKYEDIRVANSADKNEKTSIADNQNKSSVLEREVMETVKKPALLLMALCVRRPELIKTLFEVSCRDKADALHKAVQANMAKMAKAVGAKEGTAVAAKKVAGMAGEKETTLVLSFLDNLAPSTDKNFPSDDFIEACYEIQASKVGEDGQKDPRYIIPVVSAIKRKELAEKLADFVASSDEILLGALERMGDRVARQALLFRDEPDEENPSLKGMTLCEQLVFLHNLDFAAAGLPQKRYLDAIRLCLDNDDVFSDRVVMAALDHMSGVFLTAEKGLPLAYMRTIILVCSKHESLHSWITSVLLPRLVEGKVYTDRRQWEGWMRCAKMLENTGDSGVSSLQAIRSLPEEQFELYRTRYGEPGGNP